MKTILVMMLGGENSEFLEARVKGRQTLADVLRDIRVDHSTGIWKFTVDGTPAQTHTAVTETTSSISCEKVSR